MRGPPSARRLNGRYRCQAPFYDVPFNGEVNKDLYPVLVGMQVRCASLPFDKPNKVIVELSSPDELLLSQVSPSSTLITAHSSDNGGEELHCWS